MLEFMCNVTILPTSNITCIYCMLEFMCNATILPTSNITCYDIIGQLRGLDSCDFLMKYVFPS